MPGCLSGKNICIIYMIYIIYNSYKFTPTPGSAPRCPDAPPGLRVPPRPPPPPPRSARRCPCPSVRGGFRRIMSAGPTGGREGGGLPSEAAVPRGKGGARGARGRASVASASWRSCAAGRGARPCRAPASRRREAAGGPQQPVGRCAVARASPGARALCVARRI